MISKCLVSILIDIWNAILKFTFFVYNIELCNSECLNLVYLKMPILSDLFKSQPEYKANLYKD